MKKLNLMAVIFAVFAMTACSVDNQVKNSLLPQESKWYSLENLDLNVLGNDTVISTTVYYQKYKNHSDVVKFQKLFFLKDIPWADKQFGESVILPFNGKEFMFTADEEGHLYRFLSEEYVGRCTSILGDYPISIVSQFHATDITAEVLDKGQHLLTINVMIFTNADTKPLSIETSFVFEKLPFTETAGEKILECKIDERECAFTYDEKGIFYRLVR